jgi:hypothetical protein
LGLLLLLNRMVSTASIEWARWVLLLALGGFVGNFVLSVADHAQNGFFRGAEWLAVAASALAVGTLLAALVDYENRPWLRFCLLVMALQVVVGLLGFYFHLRGNLSNGTGSLWERFIYGAPAFAPLLFANLAVLAAIGLWVLLEDERTRRDGSVSGTD